MPSAEFDSLDDMPSPLPTELPPVAAEVATVNVVPASTPLRSRLVDNAMTEIAMLAMKIVQVNAIVVEVSMVLGIKKIIPIQAHIEITIIGMLHRNPIPWPIEPSSIATRGTMAIARTAMSKPG